MGILSVTDCFHATLGHCQLQTFSMQLGDALFTNIIVMELRDALLQMVPMQFKDVLLHGFCFGDAIIILNCFHAALGHPVYYLLIPCGWGLLFLLQTIYASLKDAC